MMTHLEEIRIKAREGDTAAFSWLLAAAKKGEVWAQVSVAKMFKDGQGVPVGVGQPNRPGVLDRNPSSLGVETA